jgi:hypothetical protein
MGLHHQVEDERAFCHNAILPSVNDEAQIWIGTAKIRKKLLSLYTPENFR